jgi:beta-lactam-binding protein with PASTA domain
MRYHSAAEMRADLQRALREPHGKFARIRRKDKEKHRRRYGILNIALLIVVFIGLFAALFFIIRAWGDGGTNGTDDYIIPTVEEKKIEDAEELAKLRGFEIFVQSYQTSTQYQEGVIISQEPMGGTRGKPGDIINVVVSSGSDRAVVPNVLEMTLPAATVEIEDQSLKVGNVEYVESERPDGEVVGQNPPEGTELLKNDAIDLQVSGTPGQVPLEMPNVTETILNKALYALREDGFSHIWLRFEKPATGEKDEIVFKQNPAAAMGASPNGLVELWVYRSVLGDFSADIADNVDVVGEEQTVVVTLEISKGVEVVLYEAVLPVGEKQPVSFTGYFLSEGEFTYMVYLNGVKVHESMALFSRKNS